MRKQLYSSDGIQIYYDISDNFQSKGCLVFLHGLGGDLTALTPLRSLFEKEGYATLAIDIRGQGESGRPKKQSDYHIHKIAKDVGEVVQAENLSEIILIGHCFGGMVAMETVRQIGEKVKLLILIDTSYQAPGFGRFFRRFPGIRFGLVSLSKILPTIRKKSQVNYEKFKGGSDFSVRRIFSDMLHTSLKSYLMLLHTVLTINLKETAQQIKIPTLIIEGENDRIYPPNVAKELHSLISSSSYSSIPNANHILVISNVKEVFEVIKKAVETTPQK